MAERGLSDRLLQRRSAVLPSSRPIRLPNLLWGVRGRTLADRKIRVFGLMPLYPCPAFLLCSDTFASPAGAKKKEKKRRKLGGGGGRWLLLLPMLLSFDDGSTEKGELAPVIEW
jgi:hypothetical protein